MPSCCAAFPFPKPPCIESRRQKRRSDSSGHPFLSLGTNGLMNSFLLRFFADVQALKLWLLSLKHCRCPFCHCAHSLNRHSILYGNNPNCNNDNKHVRGQRVFCSNRGQRGGCGRTFSVFLADVFPRFCVRASLLWRLLGLLLAGQTVFGATPMLRPSFSQSTFYRLVHLLRQRLDILRPLLCRICLAPASSRSDPLLQTVEHFKAAFPKSGSPLDSFQAHFQSDLLGSSS